MESDYRESRHYAFFRNSECEYFPCHDGVDPEKFNCLFCYCPLYVLPDCGGNCVYLKNGDGAKDCSGCVFPHIPENYGQVIRRYREIAEIEVSLRTRDKEKNA